MPAETHNECCAKDEFTLCLKTIVELYPYIIKDLLLRSESVVIVTEDTTMYQFDPIPTRQR